jgi:predicted metal-binding membrane protein
MTPMMAPATLVLAGTTLVAAGIYQFTPAKLACLARCQRPILFPMDRRYESLGEVFRLGLVQGLLCLGCCWALMTVMFAVGVMNVLWIATLGLMMAIEKTVFNVWVPRAIGVVLIVWGLSLLAVSEPGRVLLAG